MKGETGLTELIKGMRPRLNDGEYVFVLKPASIYIPFEQIISFFQENEGTTLILKRQKAEELGLPFDFVSAWITLDVHSSLKAIGLTAAVSNALAKNSISCNVIAGYYHDHIFVETSDANEAVEILRKLSENFKES